MVWMETEWQNQDIKVNLKMGPVKQWEVNWPLYSGGISPPDKVNSHDQSRGFPFPDSFCAKGTDERKNATFIIPTHVKTTVGSLTRSFPINWQARHGWCFWKESWSSTFSSTAFHLVFLHLGNKLKKKIEVILVCWNQTQTQTNAQQSQVRTMQNMYKFQPAKALIKNLMELRQGASHVQINTRTEGWDQIYVFLSRGVIVELWSIFP